MWRDPHRNGFLRAVVFTRTNSAVNLNLRGPGLAGTVSTVCLTFGAVVHQVTNALSAMVSDVVDQCKPLLLR